MFNQGAFPTMTEARVSLLEDAANASIGCMHRHLIWALPETPEPHFSRIRCLRYLGHLLPELSDDAVQDADFVELIRLPEPSPADLFTAVVVLDVMGVHLDVVNTDP
ncbi:hypothetical protein JG688_00003413 [Phytophthora aleatoria]|uniref:Uncharacterized protein n=1 Tax=Phytophthora aleatoria TaxID=2496075 RepID=A0A8J5ITG3_9STRA|nr:hypothetical protein JG688_00003413 [Phytophthora aleatoria]